MINKAIAQLDVVGLVVLDFVRTIPKMVYAAFMVVALVLVGQPAQALSTVVPAANDPLAFIGCPTLAWATPLQGTAQTVTGMIFGFVVVAILFIMFGAGMSLVFARSRQDKAAGAIETAKNAGTGAIVVLVGVPLIALVVWGLATALNPACTA